jgi:hypothetical protein
MSGPDNNLDKALNTNLLVTRIIVGAMSAGVVVALGVFTALRLTGDNPPSQPMLGFIGLALAAAALVGVAVVPNIIARTWERQVARGGSWPPRRPGPEGKLTADEETTFRWWALYQSALIIRCALLEGAAFFQAIAFLIEGNLFSIGVGLALLAVLLYQWPNRGRVDRWVEARREAVERLQRGELP